MWKRSRIEATTSTLGLEYQACTVAIESCDSEVCVAELVRVDSGDSREHQARHSSTKYLHMKMEFNNLLSTTEQSCCILQ